MQNNRDRNEIILSIIQFLILNTINDFYTCLKHVNIPSNGGEFRGTKIPLLPPIFFSYMFYACFQGNQLTVIVMSFVSSRLTPEQQEYFQHTSPRIYKVCNRYKISTTTLEDFGLKIIDQGKRTLPKVWSTDIMSINTQRENENQEVKPFCCTHCGSENYKKYGKKNGKQVYKCKDCNRKFVDNMFFERRKADPKIICLTLDLYFKGVSLRKVSDHLKQFHDIDICFTTVFRWIEHYIRVMDEYTRQFQPQTSEIWNADEMMIKVGNDWFYLWNVIDDETRFHLASVVSKERTTKDARKVLITAKKRSYGKRPQFIITDGLKSYVKAIDDEFHTVKRDTIHVSNVGIRGKHAGCDIFDNNLVERLHGTIRERNKTQRGLKDEYSAFVRGHQLYYNFIRPHMSLCGCTPAEVADIDLNLRERKWENLLMQSLKYHNGEKYHG